MTPARRRRSTLRFTGRLPTERALARYPSWCYAFDEEGRPGQDESTLRPTDDQRRMGPDTACTAAQATVPDGTEYVALETGWRPEVELRSGVMSEEARSATRLQ